MILINRLKEVFKEKKVTNRQIATYLKKSEPTISKWVNNRRQPSLDDLYKIAEYLQIDIRSLLYPSNWGHMEKHKK